MTKAKSNSGITVLSNPFDLDRTPTLHFALWRVDAGEVLLHSGFYGPVQRFAWDCGGYPLPEEQDALYGLLRAKLAAVDNLRSVSGNPVRITLAGERRLAVWNAASLLAGAA